MKNLNNIFDKFARLLSKIKNKSVNNRLLFIITKKIIIPILNYKHKILIISTIIILPFISMSNVIWNENEVDLGIGSLIMATPLILIINHLMSKEKYIHNYTNLVNQEMWMLFIAQGIIGDEVMDKSDYENYSNICFSFLFQIFFGIFLNIVVGVFIFKREFEHPIQSLLIFMMCMYGYLVFLVWMMDFDNNNSKDTVTEPNPVTPEQSPVKAV